MVLLKNYLRKNKIQLLIFQIYNYFEFNIIDNKKIDKIDRLYN